MPVQGVGAMLRFLGVGAPPAPGLTVAVWCTDPAAPWLGPHGWQSTEHYFRPESAEAQGQNLVLVVGREIVDNMADFTVVEYPASGTGRARGGELAGRDPRLRARERDGSAGEAGHRDSQRASAATTSAPTGQPQARLRGHAGAADHAAANGCGAGWDEGTREPRARRPAGWARLRRAGAAVPRSS